MRKRLLLIAAVACASMTVVNAATPDKASRNALSKGPVLSEGFAKPAPAADPKAQEEDSLARAAAKEAARLAPAKAAPDGTPLPGIIASVYNHRDGSIGMYRLPEVSGGEMELVTSAVSSYYGGSLHGNVYYACDDGRYEDYWDSDNDPHGHRIQAYDINTWEPIGNPVNVETYRASDLAIHPQTGFGYAFCDYGSMMFHLYSINLQTGEQTDLTPSSNFLFKEDFRALAFSDDGVLYGVNKGAKFGIWNLETNEFTTISDLGLPEAGYAYSCAGCFDPDTGNFLYIHSFSPDYGTTISTSLYSINPTTGEKTLLADFPNYSITSMFVAPSPVADEAPGQATGLTPSFPNGSLTGTLSFMMPSTLNNGNAATGSASWTVYENTDVLATGTAAYGATVNAPLTFTQAGKHSLSVTASNAAGEGKKTRLNTWIGPDVPAAPASVNVEYVEEENRFNVSWTAVTDGANGGYVNPADIRYKVVRKPGDVTVAEATEATSLSDVYAPEGIESVVYSVKAVNGTLESAATESAPTITGTMALPYDMALTSTDNRLTGWTVIDSNNDGSTWSSSYNGIEYRYNSSNPGDDWLITPPIKVTAGTRYTVKAIFTARSTSFSERVEIKAGNAASADAMTTVLAGPTDITDTSGQEVSCELIAEADGRMHIGFHAISDRDRYYLTLKGLTISAPVSDVAPAAPVITEVTADRTGALGVTGKVAVPTTSVDGNTISAVDKIEVVRAGTIVDTIENPAVGTTVDFADNTLTSTGEFGYVAYAYIGDAKSSASEEVKTYVGCNTADEPTNLRIVRSETNPAEVTVSWDAPTVDYAGYPLNGDLTYNIEVYPDNAYYHGNKTYTGITGNSFTFTPTYETGRDHGFVYVKISAVNINGTAGYSATSPNIYAGEALTLPFAESFPNYTLTHPWGDGNSNGPKIASITDDERALSFNQYNGWNRLMDASFQNSEGSQDNDNGFAGMFGWSFVADEPGGYHDEWTELLAPTVNLTGVQNPVLSFYTYNWTANGPCENTLDVDVVAADGTRTNAKHLVIKDLGTAPGWQHVAVDLNQFAGQEVSLIFKGTIIARNDNGYNWILLDNVRIDSFSAVDLSVSEITAPVQAVPNEPFTVSALIENHGSQTVAAHSATLLHNGEEVATQDLGALEFGKNELVEFQHSLSVQDPIGNTFRIRVNAENDGNLADNETSEVTVARNLKLLPEPQDVAIANGNLKWAAPDFASAVPEMMTEGFETPLIEPNADFLTSFGDWTFIDRDQAPIGGMLSSSTMEMLEFPGVPSHSTQSWWVQTRLWEEFNNTYYGHDDSMQYLANMYTVNSTYDQAVREDDWAITPELCGREQLVTLWARSYNYLAPETVEFLYSEGSTDPDDFTLISRVEAIPGEWTQYPIVLPEGARRLAIRGCSYNVTGTAQTFIDDISYYPAAGTPQQLNLLGYNVYCDNALLNTAPLSSLLFAELPSGDHTFAVSAVYATGESRAVVAGGSVGIGDINAAGARIKTLDGVIRLENLSGAPYTVVTPAGLIIARGNGVDNIDVPAAPGVYFVTIGSRTAKLILR